MKKLSLIITLIAVLATSACKKEVAGPAGPQGAPGNANVKSTTQLATFFLYGNSYKATIYFSSITQDILDKGAVLVYEKSGSSYYPLPVTIYPSSSFSRTFNYEVFLGGVNIYVYDSDQTAPSNPGSITYKVVAMAGTPRPIKTDYETIKYQYNLSE